MTTWCCLACIGLLAYSGQTLAALRVVAAENFYGDVAMQVGGNDVEVVSILGNAGQDPHLFEISPSAAREVADARIVISNGIDYDPWMDKMLASAPVPSRQIIVVADLIRRHVGDNPHIWFDPETMLALAKRFAGVCTALDPAHAGGYAQRLARFVSSLAPVQARIAALRRRLQGTQVTATEPVLGDLIAALGMVSRNQRFQLAAMNETEASAGNVAAFEDDLRSHRAGLLIFNRQATDAVTDRMRSIAERAAVPVLGVTETEPPGMAYQPWMMGELDALDRVLTTR